MVYLGERTEIFMPVDRCASVVDVPKMKFSLIFFTIFLSTSLATKLTEETWDDAVAGKAVFIKFFAPWCGNCKQMKPAWDQLIDEFAGSKDVLVAEVDCNESGKSLCEKLGVLSYPTMKYGDPHDLQSYLGPRGFQQLKDHVNEKIKPVCSPLHVELCDGELQQKIENYSSMDDAALDDAIQSFVSKLKVEKNKHETEIEQIKQKMLEEARSTTNLISLLKSLKFEKTRDIKDEL